MRIYAIVREAFNPGLDVDRSFLRKTARLVQEHTTASLPGPATTIHELTDEVLDELVTGDAPETVKVINLVKLLHDVVAKDRDEKPFLISIGERAGALAEAFRNRQLSTEDALESLTRLSEETLEAERAQAATGLPPDAFAALWYLRGKGVAEEEAETVARIAAETFEDCPEWRLRSDQEREVRLKLHAALIRVGERNGTADYVEDIVESLRRSHR